MKDIYELLRQKELEISRLEIEVEALRVAAPLLSYDGEIGDDNQPSLARRTVPSQLTQVPQAVNAFPQPEHSAEWKEKAKGWPQSFLNSFGAGRPSQFVLLSLQLPTRLRNDEDAAQPAYRLATLGSCEDPLPAVSSGCAMRIVALDDDDHTRLRTAMESLLDRVPSSKGPSLGLNAALYVAGENSLFTS